MTPTRPPRHAAAPLKLALGSLVALGASAGLALSVGLRVEPLPVPTSVHLVGGLPGALGCADAGPCDACRLLPAPLAAGWLDGLPPTARRYLAPQHLPAFSATLEVPAGRHQFHVRTFGRDGEWVSGAGGWLDGDAFTLDLDAPRRVTFRFSPVTRWVADDVRQPLAIATGTFQRALGCERDWQDDCLQTWLQDADGDGRYTLQTRLVPVGQHEVRPAVAPAVGPVTVTPFQVLRRYEQLRFVWTRASTRVVVEFPERPATGGASPGAPAL